MKKALKSIKNKSSLLLAISAATIIGGAATSVVLAAIPDSSGIIHGCYSNKSGALKVVDSDTGQACNKNETSLNWNQGI